LQNKTYSCKGEWGSTFFLGKKHSGTNDRKYKKIKDRINSSIGGDKLAEVSWRIIPSIEKDKKERTEELWGEWLQIHG